MRVFIGSSKHFCSSRGIPHPCFWDTNGDIGAAEVPITLQPWGIWSCGDEHNPCPWWSWLKSVFQVHLLGQIQLLGISKWVTECLGLCHTPGHGWNFCWVVTVRLNWPRLIPKLPRNDSIWKMHFAERRKKEKREIRSKLGVFECPKKCRKGSTSHTQEAFWPSPRKVGVPSSLHFSHNPGKVSRKYLKI